MNPRLSKLQAYPFERLQRLVAGVSPNQDKALIKLTVGEPKHAPPKIVVDTLRNNAERAIASYPSTRGLDALRGQIAEWLQQRFNLRADPSRQILPVNGTREGLFAIAQTLINPDNDKARVLMPNPFYQIYEGAAILAGANPCYLPANAENSYLPVLEDIPAKVLDACELFYLCTPGNPHGSCCSLQYLQQLIELAHRHDFTVISDECYSEIYRNQPPASLLEASLAFGDDQYRHCLVFHSLSKRSNLPGLRSGFVAGNDRLIEQFLNYRTYHGSAMSELVQLASISAWSDETHVSANRNLYNTKFESVANILGNQVNVSVPEGGFYLWLNVHENSETFCKDLYEHQHVLALPGSYLSRDVDGLNPGETYIRLSLVDTPELSSAAAERLLEFLQSR